MTRRIEVSHLVLPCSVRARMAGSSVEVFAVRLSEAGVEERRDFVGAGFPIVPQGLAASAEHTAVFGSVGGRALWLER